MQTNNFTGTVLGANDYVYLSVEDVLAHVAVSVFGGKKMHSFHADKKLISA